MTALYHNARAVDASGVRDETWLLVEGDRIVRAGTGDGWREHLVEASTVLDLADRLLVPGFIDLHCHGGGGHSFEDGGTSIRAALAAHRQHGTTRSVISLVASPIPDTIARLREIEQLAESDPLLLGAHLEGPFLEPSKRGAHAKKYLVAPDEEAVDALLRAAPGALIQVTIAPELSGAFDAIERFARAGVISALGHTNAGYEIARLAFNQGARILTHAFNAMPAIGHREPGPIVAAFDDTRVTLELIADGFHVRPEVVRLAFTNAPGRIALITDAMAGAGVGDGSYSLGDLQVEVKQGCATVKDSNTLAGSVLTLDAALRGAVGAGVGLIEAVSALTATPARAIGRQSELGLLAPGYFGDLVVLSDSLDVERVMAAGQFLR